MVISPLDIDHVSQKQKGDSISYSETDFFYCFSSHSGNVIPLLNFFETNEYPQPIKSHNSYPPMNI
jgi:hypothetical protein